MKINIDKKRARLFLSVLLISVILCVLRIILLVKFTEQDTGFYVQGTNVNVLFDGLVVLGTALCTFLAYAESKRDFNAKLGSDSNQMVFFSSLCAFVFVTVFVYGVYMIATKKMADTFFMIEILLCLPCFVNFFLVCLKENRQKSAKQMILCIFVSLFYAVRVIDTFMDVETQMNTSYRTLNLLMLCAMMLFFVTEAGFLADADKDEGQNKGLKFRYVLSSALAGMFVLVSAFPSVLLNAFWLYNSQFLLMDLLDVCVGIYVSVRFYSLCVKE